MGIGEVFIHQAQFEDGVFNKQPDKILGNLIKNDRGSYKLNDITEIDTIPMSEVNRLSGKWRFPILTLFD